MEIRIGNAYRLGRLDHIRRDHGTVRLSNTLFRQFTRNNFLDLVLQAEGDTSNLSGWNGRGNVSFAMSWQQCLDLIVEMPPVAVVPLEQSNVI
jgi:hypothetical protein